MKYLPDKAETRHGHIRGNDARVVRICRTAESVAPPVERNRSVMPAEEGDIYCCDQFITKERDEGQTLLIENGVSEMVVRSRRRGLNNSVIMHTSFSILTSTFHIQHDK